MKEQLHDMRFGELAGVVRLCRFWSNNLWQIESSSGIKISNHFYGRGFWFDWQPPGDKEIRLWLGVRFCDALIVPASERDPKWFEQYDKTWAGFRLHFWNPSIKYHAQALWERLENAGFACRIEGGDETRRLCVCMNLEKFRQFESLAEQAKFALAFFSGTLKIAKEVLNHE